MIPSPLLTATQALWMVFHNGFVSHAHYLECLNAICKGDRRKYQEAAEAAGLFHHFGADDFVSAADFVAMVEDALDRPHEVRCDIRDSSRLLEVKQYARALWRSRHG